MNQNIYETLIFFELRKVEYDTNYFSNEMTEINLGKSFQFQNLMNLSKPKYSSETINHNKLPIHDCFQM